jgi:hypothetical protein
MNRLAKFAIAALAAGVPATASAQVEYTIEVDPAFPSVVYVEYDPSTLPQIYTAPEGGGRMPVIIDGGYNDSGASGQPVDSGKTSSSSGGDETVQSLDDRARDRVNDLLQSDGKKLEDLIIDREIEDAVIDRVYD